MMVKRGRSWSPPNIKYDKLLNHTTLHYYIMSFIECGKKIDSSASRGDHVNDESQYLYI